MSKTFFLFFFICYKFHHIIEEKSLEGEENSYNLCEGIK